MLGLKSDWWRGKELSEGFLVVQVSWGWCGVRRSEAGLRSSTLPLATRDEAIAPVAEGAAWDCHEQRAALMAVLPVLHEIQDLLGAHVAASFHVISGYKGSQRV